mgnify:FL=1
MVKSPAVDLGTFTQFPWSYMLGGCVTTSKCYEFLL